MQSKDLSVLQLAGCLEYVTQLGVATSVFVVGVNCEHRLIHRVILGHLPAEISK